MSDEQGPNPFEGTPFEQLFNAILGGGQGNNPLAAFGLGGSGQAGGGFGNFDLGSLMSQMQFLMQPHEGAVNWALAKDLARKASASTPDPSVTETEQRRIADALQLADHWLDDATQFPSGVKTTHGWSRAEWIENTLPVWKQLVEPVAEHVVGALGNAMPQEAKAMAGPFAGLLSQAGGAMFGSQIGTALAGLAAEVLSASDVGLPLGPAGKAALMPANIAAFADGLDVGLDDVRLYLALREAAHQRLFAQVAWLGPHLIAAVEEYGRGTSIDVSGMESKLGSFDISNPQAFQDALTQGLFEPEKTPLQKAALLRLETVLALVEGWVDDVVGQASESKMPSAAKLREVVRRRRAAGGPAETAFAALVGLELRPRRLRDASTLWGGLRTKQGPEARDSVWQHPDLLPTAADLDDPLGFGAMTALDSESAEFDDALAEMLGEATPPTADEASTGRVSGRTGGTTEDTTDSNDDGEDGFEDAAETGE